jgi:Ca2+-binding EF-hand superfamily protein
MQNASIFWVAAICAALVTFAAPAGADEDQLDHEKLFERLDANHDSKLTPDEIGDDQRKFFDRLVRNGDQDDDGTLTRAEFLEVAGKRDKPVDFPNRRGRRRERQLDPEALFKRFDTNGDGSITMDEAPEKGKQLLERLYRRGKKESTDSLSKQEFIDLLPQRRNRNERPDAADGKPRGNKTAGKKRSRDSQSQKGRRRRGDRDRDGARHQPVFLRMADTNKDGRLDREELAALVDKFDKLDENQDGSLDPRELLGPPPAQLAENRRDGDRMRRFRDRRRRDRDDGPPRGRRSRRERGDEGRHDGPSAEQLLKRFDENEDGKITEDEAPERLKEGFSKLDKNGDGAVDADELKSGLQQRRRGRSKRGGDRPRRPPEA